ncbi:MAG: choice-of-anchor X domain-containing protein [Acidobacteriota bacterium]
MKVRRSHLIASFAIVLAAAPQALLASEAAVTGSFPEGQLYSPPEFHAPAHVSRFSVQTLELVGARATVEVMARGEGPLWVWIVPIADIARAETDARVACTIISPAGRELEAGEGSARVREFDVLVEEFGIDASMAQKAFELREPEAGVYRVEIRSDVPAVTVVTAEPSSELTLKTWAGPLSRLPGEPVVLHAELQDGSAPLAGGHVTARLAAPNKKAGGEPVDLFDDGQHADGAAGDGVYAVGMSELEDGGAGFWTVRFEAQGTDARGLPFARTGSAGFVNEPGAARLTRDSVTAKLVSSRGGRYLRVEATTNVSAPGLYRLQITVAGAPAADGTRRALAWGELTRQLPVGRSKLALEIPVEQIRAAAAEPLFVDIQLVGLEPMGVAGRTVLEITP